MEYQNTKRTKQKLQNIYLLLVLGGFQGEHVFGGESLLDACVKDLFGERKEFKDSLSIFSPAAGEVLGFSKKQMSNPKNAARL